MEETQVQIAIGEAGKAHLAKAAKWAKFIAVIQFIYIGIVLAGLIIMMLGAAVAGASFPEMTGMSGMYGNPGLPRVFWIVYAVVMIPFLLLIFFFTLYLYRFATNTLQAVREGNDEVMTGAFANLGKFFCIQGIVIIVALAFVALAIVAAIVAVIATGGIG
jgi:hypothetical protein